MREPIDFEDGFLEGVEATKTTIKQDIIDNYEAWDQGSTDERCWTIDELEVQIPNVRQR